MRRLDRRQFVKLGFTTGAAALAGCTGTSGGGDGSGTYTDWLPASEGGLVAAYVDFTLSEDEATINPVVPLILPSNDGGSGGFVPDLSGIEDIDDPLLRLPLRTGGLTITVGALSIAVTGLGDALDPNAPEDGISELLVADGAVVGMGDIDADAADEALRAGSGGPLDSVQFEAADEDGAFTLYDPVESDDAAAAVSGSAVVVAADRAGVRAALDAYRGDRERAAEAGDTLAAFLDDAGSGHIVVGWAAPADFEQFTFGDGPGPETDLVGAEDDAVSSVTFEPSADEVVADLAVRTPDLDAAAEERFRSTLGTAAESESLSVDGDRLTATATYAESEVGIGTQRVTETPEPTTPPEGEDVPPAVAEAVPDGAFGFEYDPEEESVRVKFEKEMAADEVTIRTAESGWESSTSTPQPDMYLVVYVDPEGDEVVVSATVDGETGVVARHEVP